MKEKISLVLNILQTIVLILILVVLLTDKREPGPKQMKGQLEVQYRDTIPIKLTDTDAIWGSKDAPTTLVAFIDYECPYCKDLYRNIKEIEKDYIETGKVKVIFRDLPLRMHENARELAAAVECARKEGKFWELAGLVLQSTEKYDGSQLAQWAEQSGLDAAEMENCTSDTKILDAVIADIREARSRKLTGTPAVYINDVFYTWILLAAFCR